MIARLPIIPTLVVIAAVLTMVGLGIWQIGRAQEKDDLKAAMVERPDLPVLDYPFASAGEEKYLYRRLQTECDEVIGMTVAGGKDASGRTGWRQIALCRNKGFDTVFPVQIGLASDPSALSDWAGGPVEGLAKEAPDTRGLLERMFSGSAQRPAMIVTSEPKAGLRPSAPPNPEEYRNTSWAYAGQWFFFAITALFIYGFAVKGRIKKSAR